MKAYFNGRKKRAGLLLLEAAAVIAVCAACGKPAEGEKAFKPESTAEPTTEPTAALTSTPGTGEESIPTQEPTEALTPEPTLTPTSEPTPTPMPEPTAAPESTLVPEPTAASASESTAAPTPEWFGEEPFQLENDTFIDFEVDGMAEHIVYSTENAATVYINDKKMELQGEGEDYYYIGEDDVFGDYAEVISLDGATLQLVLRDYAEGHSFFIRIYDYWDEELHLLAYLPAISYGIKEMDDERQLVTVGEGFFLECCIVEREYTYKDGKIELIPKEFYEYRPTWYVVDTTVLRELPLYADKNGTPGITIPEGCVVDVLGSDLKEWVLIKNMETGEEGWLRMKDEGCVVLPDGEEIFNTDLFDGLSLYA